MRQAENYLLIPQPHAAYNAIMGRYPAGDQRCTIIQCAAHHDFEDLLDDRAFHANGAIKRIVYLAENNIEQGHPAFVLSTLTASVGSAQELIRLTLWEQEAAHRAHAAGFEAVAVRLDDAQPSLQELLQLAPHVTNWQVSNEMADAEISEGEFAELAEDLAALNLNREQPLFVNGMEGISVEMDVSNNTPNRSAPRIRSPISSPRVHC